MSGSLRRLAFRLIPQFLLKTGPFLSAYLGQFVKCVKVGPESRHARPTCFSRPALFCVATHKSKPRYAHGKLEEAEVGAKCAKKSSGSFVVGGPKGSRSLVAPSESSGSTQLFRSFSWFSGWVSKFNLPLKLLLGDPKPDSPAKDGL